MISRKWLFIASVSVLAVYGAVMVLAPALAPYSPLAISGPAYERPGPLHPLGTNDIGQDIFSQLMYGARTTVIMGFLAAGISVGAGTIVGVIAGYYGGIPDEAISRFVDISMAVPLFPLLLILTLFFTPGLVMTAVIMGILGCTRGIRLIRSRTLSIARERYIEGARAVGAGNSYILRRHVLPNTLPLVMVEFVSSVQHFMVLGVGLSFLGLGDPMVIDWGQMLQRAYSSGGFVLGMWWWLLPPGVAIVGISVALALFGYSLEDRVNPRISVMRL